LTPAGGVKPLKLLGILPSEAIAPALRARVYRQMAAKLRLAVAGD
jgi:hypothetical protein